MLIRLPASVGARVATALLVMAVVALGGAGATYLGMEAQAERVTALTQATDGPRLVERLRAEVYAVVMESRGLYFARDARQAAGFAITTWALSDQGAAEICACNADIGLAV